MFWYFDPSPITCPSLGTPSRLPSERSVPSSAARCFIGQLVLYFSWNLFAITLFDCSGCPISLLARFLKLFIPISSPFISESCPLNFHRPLLSPLSLQHPCIPALQDLSESCQGCRISGIANSLRLLSILTRTQLQPVNEDTLPENFASWPEYLLFCKQG